MRNFIPYVSARTTALLWLSFLAVGTVWLGGCSPKPPDEETAKVSDSGSPGVEKPTLVLSGIQEQPSSGTDCALPTDFQTVDIFGVPKDEYIQVRIRFAREWEGVDKEFGVEAERSDIAWTSESETGPHQKVTVKIRRGDRVSTEFYIQGKAVDRTRLVVDEVTDDRKPEDIYDNLHYPKSYTPIVVWDFTADDIVDYNALGGDETQRCYESGPNSTTLKADPATRVNCGSRATSVASDGVSHQLLRLKAGGYGRACFTIIDKQDFTDRTAEQYYGSISDPLMGSPGQALATNVETSFEFALADNPTMLHWALGTYTPPTDFYDSGEKERKVKLEVQFMALDENGVPVRSHITAKKKELEITIKRPPVLLVHGLWSSSETWGDGFRNPKPQGGWVVDGSFNYPGSAPSAPKRRRMPWETPSTAH